MESRVIQLTSAAHKHGNLNISLCGKDFFPPDVYGGSSRSDKIGVPVKIKTAGLNRIVETDIPVDRKTKRPRGMFRERSWVKEFVRANGLIPGDTLTIRHITNRTYELIPHKRQLTFIDLFAGIGGTRLAFEKAGCKCVFSSEWDRFAQQTYETNFDETSNGYVR